MSSEADLDECDSGIRVVFGGDVNFDLEIRNPMYLGVYRVKRKGENQPVKDIPWNSLSGLGKMGRRLGNKLYRIWEAAKWSRRERPVEPIFDELLVKTPENEERAYLDPYFLTATRFEIEYGSCRNKYDYPFQKISPLLRTKDFVLVDLETPLALGCRPYGYFVSDTNYAMSLKKSGISMVSLANNHSFDAGEIGFLQTIRALEEAGVSYTGAGANFERARAGASVDLKGIRLTFLGYTQFCNQRFASVASEYAGILPLDPELIAVDIQRAKDNSDLVFPVLHWGIENDPNVHSTAVEIAHHLIDSGADGIIGHHAHIPQGIEIYRNKPVLYSLGNFIFGHDRPQFWSDNCLAEFVIRGKSVHQVLLYPISGRGSELFQPEVLSGERAHTLLRELKNRSAVFGTVLDIRENRIEVDTKQ